MDEAERALGGVSAAAAHRPGLGYGRDFRGGMRIPARGTGFAQFGHPQTGRLGRIMRSIDVRALGAAVVLAAASCTQISVDLVPVADVAVLPPQLETEVSERVALGTELRAASGELLSGRPVAWSSTDPTVARVDSLGIVTAVAPGQTIIAAEVEGRLGTALILVSEPPPIGPPPSRPTDLKANDDGSTAIELEWDDNSDNEAGFEVQRRQGKGAEWSLVREVPANATRYRDAGLQPETEYEYRVRACNAAGCSQYSNRDKTKTDDD